MTPTLEVTEVGLGQTLMKAAEAVQTGLRTLEFYAAAFSEEGDSYGHIIDPKAFDGWLPKFYAKGQALPISFNHAAMLDSTDPTNVIGYAPADPEHVWVDDYGLRVKALIDTKSEKGRAVEWQIENGLLKGSSLAFLPGDMTTEKAGKMRIKTIENVKEAGPVPNPANQDAVLLWLKSEGALSQPTELPYMTVEEFRQVLMKAVDTSGWDGNRAMGMCNSAADFESICAATHTVGEPGQRQHYALPHHYLGKGPNAKGVAAAVGRIDQTENITDAERASARTHLAAHQREIQGTQKSEGGEEDVTFDTMNEMIMNSSPEEIQAAHDALHAAGAKCSSEEDERLLAAEEMLQTPDTTGLSEAAAERARKLRLLEASLP